MKCFLNYELRIMNYKFMKDNIIYEKALNFAVRIVNLYKFMIEVKQERIMSKQLLRSGTSIGANISEAIFAQSSVDFIHKLSISQKEANETKYWLTLLERTEYLSKKEADSMLNDCEELRKLLSSIILTTKQNHSIHHS